MEDPVDEQGSGSLVEFIFDGLAANRDFDDHVDGVRRVIANRD
jgi:hypothetical protein